MTLGQGLFQNQHDRSGATHPKSKEKAFSERQERWYQYLDSTAERSMEDPNMKTFRPEAEPVLGGSEHFAVTMGEAVRSQTTRRPGDE